MGTLLDLPIYGSIIQVMFKAALNLQSMTTSFSFAVANIHFTIELWVDDMDLAMD